MSNAPRFLVFNWKVNGKTIKERFRSTSYNPSNDDYEICDYIFQMYPTLSSYWLEDFREKTGKLDATINEYFSKIITISDLFLNATSSLKSDYAWYMGIQRIYNEYLDAYKRSGNYSVWDRFWRWTDNYLVSSPETEFCLYLTNKFKTSIEYSSQKRDITKVAKWLNDTRKKIQAKANELVENMEHIYSCNLWNDFKDSFNIDGCLCLSEETKEKIKVFNGDYDRIVQSIETLCEGHQKYVQKGGCYALCKADNEKYYSLSGVSDYYGCWKDHPKLQNNDPMKINSLRKFLAPFNDFKYAPLRNNVMCYSFKSREDFPNPYLPSPKAMSEAIQLYLGEFTCRDVSCSERKIMAKIKDAHEYKFFIRKPPCFLCQPAMVPDGTNSIIAYIPSEDKMSLQKIKVEYDSLSESYKIKDIP